MPLQVMENGRDARTKTWAFSWKQRRLMLAGAA
jgi:phosphoenolpyruvate carboxylase